MEIVLNLTQHAATQVQLDDDVVDLPDDLRARLIALLTFKTLPSATEIGDRAQYIANLCVEHEELLNGQVVAAMIGGALWLMEPLGEALLALGIEPVFSFSERASTETTLPDGSVRKTAVFEHRGFVRPFKDRPELRQFNGLWEWECEEV